jgi:hypothetical protein
MKMTGSHLSMGHGVIGMRKPTTIMVLVCLGASILTAFLPVVTAKVTPDNCLETETGTWCSKTILTESEKFDGVNFGDVDNNGKLDVVGVGLSGQVWVARYVNHEWTAQKIWDNPGELLQPAVGDVDNDGKNEIVVGGMVAGPEADTGAGQVTMLKGSGTQWTATRIYTSEFMVHGIDVGDFDPDHPGIEIVIGTFGYNMTELAYTNSKWVDTLMLKAGHKVRTVVVGDADDDGKNEVTGISKDGNVYIVKKVSGAWTNKVVYTDTVDGVARGGIGDYDGDGVTDIVTSGDSADLALVKRTGTTWSGSVIFHDSDKMRGDKIGDVYDGHPGNEIVGAGYSGNVTMHYQVGTAWKHVLLFHDMGRLHDLKIADVDPDHPGIEIITCGYSNRVTIVAQYHPNFSVDMTPKGYSVIDKTEVAFTVTVSSKDYYTDDLNVAVTGLPTGATATVSTGLVTLTSEKAVVTVTVKVPSTVANGNTTFTVKVTGQAGSKNVTGWLKVLRTVAPKVTAPTAGETAKKGQAVTYTFQVQNSGNMADTFDIVATSSNGLPLTVSMMATPALQPGASVTVSVTMTISKDTKAKTDQLTLKATSKFDGTTANSGSVTTTIKEASTGGGVCGGVIWVSMLASLGAVGVVGYLRPRRR